MEAFAVVVRQRLPTRATNFFGARHVIEHPLDAPTATGWLSTDVISHEYFINGVLVGDVVINLEFPRPTQSVGGWRLTGYPWNDATKWVRANWFVGTSVQRFALSNPGFRSIWYETDTGQIYVRQLTGWEEWSRGWGGELERLQSVLSTHTRFNFYDAGSTSQFLGWSKSALVSERRLAGAQFISSGANGRGMRRSNYSDINGAVTGGDPPFLLVNNEDSPAPTGSLEHEILHYGGNGADWVLEMVPQLSHLQGLSGFRLVGRAGRVRAKLTNVLTTVGTRGYPGITQVLPGTTVQAVTLQGTMKDIASYYLSITGTGSQTFMEFHIVIDGTMAPGSCTIGANIQFATGGFVTQPSQQYLPMVVPIAGGFVATVFPLWVEVDLPNSSTPAPGFSVDGRQIYSSGVLPDDTYCDYLAGYVAPAPRPKAGERCDRFSYYSPNGAVRPLGGNDFLLGIGKSVPCGISGDMVDDSSGSLFAPGYYLNSAEPTDPDVELVDVAVNRRGDRPGNNSALCKTIPFVKHSEEAVSDRFTEEGPRQFALVEVTVQRQPVLSGDYHVMPTLPDHPTSAIQVKVGYYVAGNDGVFVHAGITIDLAANVNVGRWRGLLFVKSDRGLVYDSSGGEPADAGKPTVNITGLVSVFDGTEVISAGALPMRANYLTETQRLLQAL